MNRTEDRTERSEDFQHEPAPQLAQIVGERGRSRTARTSRAMNIRRAVEPDLPRIYEIFDVVIAEGDSYDFESDPGRERMRRLWWPDNGTTFVAEQDGLVVGAMIVRPSPTASDPSVSNAAFLVAPEARGSGVGTALGEFAVEEARRQGYRAMQFSFVVSTNQSAVRLWQRLGFAIIRRLEGAFRHPRLGPVDAYVMRRELTDGDRAKSRDGQGAS